MLKDVEIGLRIIWCH